MSEETVTPLRHSDNEFAVRQRVDHAPATMLVRELVKNSLEAAALAPLAFMRRVKILAVPYMGTLKLAFWNGGPGMDADKLIRILDLNVSGEEKRQSIRENYGIGAKLVGLKCNKLGLIYFSCAQGRIYRAHIKMGRDVSGHEVYGKVRQQDQHTGEYHEALDVTTTFPAFIRSTSLKSDDFETRNDWTLVILLGNQEDQDTARDPYGDGQKKKSWIVRDIQSRFYTFPHVTVKLHQSATGIDDDHLERQLRGLSHVWDVAEMRAEGNFLSNPYAGVIRYILLKESEGGGVGQRYNIRAHAGIVFKDEVYNYADTENRRWSIEAARMGISYGCTRVAVQVLLRDSSNVAPSEHRTDLVVSDARNDHKVQLEDFYELIAKHRPAWLVDYIKSKAPKEFEPTEDLRKQLRAIFDEILGALPRKVADPSGSEHMAEPDLPPEHPGERPIGPEPNPNGSLDEGPIPARYSGTSRRRYEEPRWKRAEFFEERGKPDRFALYDDKMSRTAAAEGGRYFLNEDYQPFVKAIEQLVGEYASRVAVPELLRTEIENAAKPFIMARAVRVYAHAMKHRNTEYWTETDFSAVIGSEALTLALDDLKGMLEHVQSIIGARWGIGKMPNAK